MRVPELPRVQERPYVEIATADVAMPDYVLSDADRRVAQPYVLVVGAYEQGWIRDDRVVGAQDPSRPFDLRTFCEYWCSQWAFELMPIRKEEIQSLMLAEAFDGIFIHKVWTLREHGGTLELLVVIEVTPGITVEDFMRLLFEVHSSRPRYQQASGGIRDLANDLDWCHHMATLWHPDGRYVLVTCQVPLEHRMSCLSMIRVNRNTRPSIQVVGMLGHHPNYRTEPLGVSGYGPEEN